MSYTFEFSESVSGPPAGTYSATFDRVESVGETQFSKESCRFVWRVIAPEEHAGTEASVLCTIVDETGKQRPPAGKNKLGRILSGLNGDPLSPGDKVDAESFKNRKYLIQVEESLNGNGTFVSTVLPAIG